MEKTLWHTLAIKKIFEELNSSKDGINSPEAEKRLKKFGYNKLAEEKKLSGLKIFLNQFKSPLVYVLFGAAVISLLLKDFLDAAVIMVAVFINTILGFYQENKANKSITFLKKLVDHKAKVLRDGQKIEIDSKLLVPGDIIFIEAGDKIPADARLINTEGLQVIESALTGESVASDKNLTVLDKGIGLAERENMVYSGTIIAAGRGQGIVCETGINTEIGKISQMVKDTKEDKTPLQLQLAKFSQNLTYLVIFLCLVIIVIGLVQGRPLFGVAAEAREGMLTTAAAIAVAAIPEGLLVSVTAVLAIGMQAILRRKALVRKLIAAETLGGVSIICTDKTGTLTEGNMQVSMIITASDEISTTQDLRYQSSANLKDHDLMMKISVLCNNAVITNPRDQLENWEMLGAPTETGLLLGAIQAGIPYQKITKEQPRLAEIPFSSDRKYMATLNRLDSKKNVVYVKGAPEKVMAMCSQVRTDGKKVKLTEKQLRSLKTKYEKLTGQGLRLLAFAYKKTAPEKDDLTKELKQLVFLGFIALKDPLRKETKETFQLAIQAGIRPIIVTGDHRLTAQAIVSELGLKVSEKNIIEGPQLDDITDEQLEKMVKDIDIYARVEPRHKLRIIKAWQDRGETVAMTGDGVNDAPALKAADIGIALGSGTDIAKETSDLILLDNNFKTIVAAVERGRVVYENIKKILIYLLANTFAEMVLIIGSLILVLPLPILPAQIIWINLITDSLPNLALTFENGEKEVMKDKPRKKTAKILDANMKSLIFIIGISTDLVLLGLFFILVNLTTLDIDQIRTIIFSSIALASLMYVFSCRNLRHSVFLKNPFDNKFLNLAVIIGVLVQILAIYQPTLQKILNTVPLSSHEWLIVLALATIKIIFIEIGKYRFIVKPRLA
ncbi:MAG: HAD-IC family P-type ATPase [Candidatus Buchananbacteria bacterium]|nr:HAD-IC family P-type ATPase [Candidatus Buchananbacteria bacterium]